MIEILQFRLAPGADERSFREADRRVQTEFAYHQPGLLRRTTARGEGGEWIVVDLWASVEAADAADRRWAEDAVAQGFMAYVDGDSVRTARYLELA